MLAVFDYMDTIYEDVFHASRVLVRFFERGVIGDCCRIEHHDVGEHSFFQHTAMIELEILRGLRTQTADRFRQGKDFFVATIFAEDPRETAVSARMRVRFQERTFRRLGRFIGAE